MKGRQKNGKQERMMERKKTIHITARKSYNKKEKKKERQKEMKWILL